MEARTPSPPPVTTLHRHSAAPCRRLGALTLALAVAVAAVAVSPALARSGPAVRGSILHGLAHEAARQVASRQLGPPTTIESVTAGALLFASDVDGVYRAAPELEQRIEIEVFGLVARTRVEQRFTNPLPDWVEAVYVFPLPERSAVDELWLRVGEREIRGEIQEREQAERTYEAAKASGRRASLVSQERPNVFTNSVANIGPGAEIVVTIEFQEDLRYDQGRIGLRFPLVVAPRYVPGTRAVAGFGGTGWGTNTDVVPDAERITPPVLLTAADLGGLEGDPDGESAAASGPLRGVEITVAIDRNLELEEIRSPSHELRVTETPRAYVVELNHGPVAADRDFVLEWWPEGRAAPQAALYTHDLGGHTYAHLVVVPPQDTVDPALLEAPRDLLFVIDTSGSMGGASIEQARAALDLALRRLRPADTFDVIEFNSDAHALFGGPTAATASALEHASRFVGGLRARGGTNLRAALELALHGRRSDPPAEAGPPRLTQIVFVTDGAVGNEMELFAVVERELGERRLFTVGIGSAPNGYFMRRAARFGRGTFTTISDPAEVERRMGELFAKLEAPALVDVELEWEGWSAEEAAAIEVWPERVPDLYAGEPVVLNARLPLLEDRADRAAGHLILRGRRGGEEWQTHLAIERGALRPGIDRLWAREKVRSLMDELARGAALETVRPQVVALGLNHHLVTKFTSLVAVDPEPVRPPGEGLLTKAQPVRLPAGWEAEAVFGPLPAGGTSSRLLMVLGALALLLGWAVRRAV